MGFFSTLTIPIAKFRLIGSYTTSMKETRRLPIKLHRHVCLILTEDAILAEELLSRRKISQEIVGRLSDRVLLVRPGKVAAVIEELKKLGHTPQVIGK